MKKLAEAKWSAIKAEMREVLVEMARRGQIVTYSELCALLKTAYIHYHSPMLVKLLTEIGTTEAAAGRPMLPALVVAKGSRMPGPGFFKIDSGEEIADPQAYWQEQLDKVFEYWGRH